MEHLLKIKKLYFDAVLAKEKTFEIRKNDRLFNPGDKLVLFEIDENDFETGRHLITKVTYILQGPAYGLSENYCIMSIKLCGKQIRSNVSKKPADLKEVLEYALKLSKSDQSAQNFMNYYQSTGWKMKTGLPIADWKAAFRNWKDYNSLKNTEKTFENIDKTKSLLPIFLQKIAEIATKRNPIRFKEPAIGMICRYYGFDRLAKPFNSYELNDLIKNYESYKRLGSGIDELKGSIFAKKSALVPTLNEYTNLLETKEDG